MTEHLKFQKGKSAHCIDMIWHKHSDFITSLSKLSYDS